MSRRTGTDRGAAPQPKTNQDRIAGPEELMSFDPNLWQICWGSLGTVE
jgi:hypothetical protein